MSDQKTIEVRGKALYLEFRNQAATFQLLVHPDGVSSQNDYVPFGVFYRSLNASYPKRPWTTAKVSRTTVGPRMIEAGKMLTLTDANLVISTSKKFQEHVDSIFDQLTRQGFSVYKQPVIVEISNIDLDEISSDSTPYALFRRVMSARKALGFPEDLLTTTTPTL